MMDDIQDPLETTGPATSEDHDSSGDQPPVIDRYRVIRTLGQGGFGRVYLAHDGDIDRHVAIKVPTAARISRPEHVEAFLAEARILGQLDHPHIVPVYDVGRTGDKFCYVVSKYIEGSDLAARIKERRLDFQESAELVAVVAEALHHAHTRGLVHRDVKPANILIDTSGKPYVADFGLALKDEDFDRGAGFAGTPAYMSPEQARGEGHRVDGRSDIFSLGVVFYELLSGRRPFRGETRDQVLDQIISSEARPPRQIDDSIPKELERICLKAMSRRVNERYSTAKDMAEDLRLYLQAASPPVAPPALANPGLAAPGSSAETPAAATASKQTGSELPPVKIVPKGLRSFDEHDATFFLELLPGPRDRDGLPETIRFWKTRIEECDAEKTFRVGLIYGPSGCGKSSLVRAGLLPRLGRQVVRAYVEATADETEARLLRAVRKACPGLPAGGDLAGSLAIVRRGHMLGPAQKLLLVIDQFEQWLHARRGEDNTELVAALRHCDGEHLQAIVLVRDDFWLAVSRFMADLEVELLQGQNVLLVDLFDRRHARGVLRAFGQAYGTLPAMGELTRDQDAFLDRAISGLAEDNKVISVRLALFAEMVKGMPWAPATLRAVGGTEGVGVTFLEETFSSPQANPRHRLHQKAARAVLKDLLPESGSDIKGRMRSEAALREASGYAGRPRDFNELIHVLDAELRLMTPTDPQGSSDLAQAQRPEAERYYQLTHDYLVPSLRDWLTRKQRETRRGRAELRLADRSALWNAKPENRHLPSAAEWANIRLLTRSKDWTEPQRLMMKRAGRVHGARGLALSILTALAIWGGIEGFGTLRAMNLVEQLKTASTTAVPDLVEQLKSYRRWAGRPLAGLLASTDSDSDQHLRASLARMALYPSEGTQSTYLHDRLLMASPVELPVIAGILRQHDPGIENRLWPLIDNPATEPDRRFRAACALADNDSSRVDKRWDQVSPFIADRLLTAVTKNPGDYPALIETLRPLRKRLLTALMTIFRDKGRAEAERSFATNILAEYAGDDPGTIAELVMVAEPGPYASLFLVAERQREKAIPYFQAELAQKASFDWHDTPLDTAWTTPDPGVLNQIERAQGMHAERFAFCQTMALDEFLVVAESLRPCGYRPVRFRPYADGPIVRVAAVWARDGRKWRMASALTADQVRKRDDELRGANPAKYAAVDVAGYVAPADGKPVDRYAALWVERAAPDDETRLYVDAASAENAAEHGPLKAAGMTPVTIQAMRGSDEKTHYCGVWRKHATAELPPHRGGLPEPQLTAEVKAHADQTLIDLSVSPADRPLATRERAAAALQKAEADLKTKPNDAGLQWARATALVQLGEDARALDDLGVLIEKAPPYAQYAYQYRAMAHARLGHNKEAMDDLASYQKTNATSSSKLYLAVVVACELGTGQDEAFAKLEEALKRQPDDSGTLYDAACAYALASRAVARADQGQSERHAARALTLLAAAIKNGYSDYGHMEEDSDLDPIRALPAFVEMMKPGHLERRYSAVWNRDQRYEAAPIHGLDPTGQLRRCRELAAQGFRPVSISAARAQPDGPAVTASLWHRPSISEQAKDDLAERQARAAIALARLGKAEVVWPLLAHSPDPRLRSFILNWLRPLGADPEIIAAELTRRGASNASASAGRGSPDPAPPATAGLPASSMDSILFDPENSIRRALILALGTYTANSLSPAKRDPLVARLLELYQNDPDSGIHGAAEWTLRQWKEDEKLKLARAEFITNKAKTPRRWHVNSQSQSFAVIDGPAHFRMGSPPSEPSHNPDETPHAVVIPHRFAVADKEVTVLEYQRFVEDGNSQHGLAKNYLDQYSPDSKGPMIGVSWFGAAAYCNWLSKQEGLAEDQWCYLPNQEKEYDSGMTVPANILKRTGYRLPTEAEWEYACRAGTLTSRYHGLSVGLLGAYARYDANSNQHAWPGGTLIPNDLGLFDMLGNAFEWCQDRYTEKYYSVILSRDDVLDIRNPRLLRGGAFNDQPAVVRSALRNAFAPSNRAAILGFRLARTYP